MFLIFQIQMAKNLRLLNIMLIMYLQHYIQVLKKIKKYFMIYYLEKKIMVMHTETGEYLNSNFYKLFIKI